jgi:predicted MFS family arabinose efflux permease
MELLGHAALLLAVCIAAGEALRLLVRKRRTDGLSRYSLDRPLPFALACGAEAPSGDAKASAVRSLAFLMFLGADMPLSFIPLAGPKAGGAIFWLPDEMAAALPICAEMLAAGVAALASGALIDRRGWRVSFTLGATLLLAGSVLSALTAGAPAFVLARAVTGAGYGFAWMGLRGQVAAMATQQERAAGFAQLNAGIYAGHICACAVGGRLAESFGFAFVFLLAAAFPMACVIRSRFMTNALPAGNETSRAGGLKFLSNPRVLALGLLVTIPSTVCLAGFLNYHLPLFAQGEGLSPASTGSFFALYGACIIFFGPMIGRVIAGHVQRAGAFLVYGCALGAVALMLFSAYRSVTAALAAVALLGLADAFGFVGQNTCLLGLEATRTFGAGKALGVFSMVKKAGQMLAPLLFASVLAGAPRGGMFVIGAVYLCLAGAYAALARAPRGEAPTLPRTAPSGSL